MKPIVDISALIDQFQKGYTVVTPNTRLMVRARQAYESHMMSSGVVAWEAPSVVTMQMLIDRLWDLFCLREASNGSTAPAVLSNVTERSIWADIIERSSFSDSIINVWGTAKQAQEAYAFLNKWLYDGPHILENSTPESEALRSWIVDFEHFCERKNVVSGAVQINRTLDSLSSIDMRTEIGDKIALFAFDEHPPVYETLFELITSQVADFHHVEPANINQSIHRIEPFSPDEELLAAAGWANKQLSESEDSTVAIVVPGLSSQREAVVRTFDKVLSHSNSVEEGVSLPIYDISVGTPLVNAPAVQAALQILQLNDTRNLKTALRTIIASPYIGGSVRCLETRIALDEALWGVHSEWIGDGAFRELANKHCRPKEDIPSLFDQLKTVDFHGQLLPSEWAGKCRERLHVMGWPGERVLSSIEYQQVVLFEETMDEFSSMDFELGTCNRPKAISVLKALLLEKIFQPEVPASRINILGPMEAAGLSFDHMMVLSLDDATWPAIASPNPYIPMNIQKELNLPHSSAEREFEFHERLTRRILAGGAEIVVSSSKRREQAELYPSQFIVNYELMEMQDYEEDEEYIPVETESLLDNTGLPIAIGSDAPGGTQSLTDQAACAFKSYATHRLGAVNPEPTENGLSPRDKGTLLHAVLFYFWSTVTDKAALDALGDEGIKELLTECITKALGSLQEKRNGSIHERVLRIEHTVTLETLYHWMQYEKRRPDFSINELEKRKVIEMGGLKFTIQIDREDIDSESGRRILIDHKRSNNIAVNNWLGERPKDLQAPIYTVRTGEDKPLGVAYATYQGNRSKGFVGLAEDSGLLPGVKAPNQDKRIATDLDFSGLLDVWNDLVERYATDYREGVAIVNPLHRVDTCRFCKHKAACRVYEN